MSLAANGEQLVLCTQSDWLLPIMYYGNSWTDEIDRQNSNILISNKQFEGPWFKPPVTGTCVSELFLRIFFCLLTFFQGKISLVTDRVEYAWVPHKESKLSQIFMQCFSFYKMTILPPTSVTVTCLLLMLLNCGLNVKQWIQALLLPYHDILG